MRVKLSDLFLGGAISASLIFAACGGTESNGIANTTNARNSNNPNTAVVVNATATPAPATTNTNRYGNANITREEYEKNKADYDKDRGSSTIGQGANDMWLWVKTRSALMTTDDLRESTINVDVVNDVVTLKGSVGTAAQKAKAEQVAKGIKDVKSVKNELTVKPADSMTNQMTDGKDSTGGNTKGSNTNMNKK
jgi:hyperosmotically inducible periplasmic protein